MYSGPGTRFRERSEGVINYSFNMIYSMVVKKRQKKDMKLIEF